MGHYSAWQWDIKGGLQSGGINPLPGARCTTRGVPGVDSAVSLTVIPQCLRVGGACRRRPREKDAFTGTKKLREWCICWYQERKVLVPVPREKAQRLFWYYERNLNFVGACTGAVKRERCLSIC
eukprot:2906230-Rhodomonas_salina.2